VAAAAREQAVVARLVGAVPAMLRQLGVHHPDHQYAQSRAFV
jgi:hypothetical protein